MDIQQELKKRMQQVNKWSGTKEERARMDGHYEALQEATKPEQKVSVTWINETGQMETITGAIYYDDWWHCYLSEKNNDSNKLFSVGGFVDILANDGNIKFLELYDISEVRMVVQTTVEVNGEQFSIEGNWTAGVPTKYFKGAAARVATGEKKAIEGAFEQKTMKDGRVWHEQAFFEELVQEAFFPKV